MVAFAAQQDDASASALFPSQGGESFRDPHGMSKASGSQPDTTATGFPPRMRGPSRRMSVDPGTENFDQDMDTVLTESDDGASYGDISAILRSHTGVAPPSRRQSVESEQQGDSDLGSRPVTVNGDTNFGFGQPSDDVARVSLYPAPPATARRHGRMRQSMGDFSFMTSAPAADPAPSSALPGSMDDIGLGQVMPLAPARMPSSSLELHGALARTGSRLFVSVSFRYSLLLHIVVIMLP